MRFIATQRETSVFLALTSLIALYIVLSPGADNDWMLDPLTGVVTAVTGLIVCARLALGAASRPARKSASLMSDWLSAFTNSAFRRSTIGRGVPAVVTMPNQLSIS